MAGVKNVGATGNSLIDSMLTGTAWDMSTGPLYVKVGDPIQGTSWRNDALISRGDVDPGFPVTADMLKLWSSNGLYSKEYLDFAVAEFSAVANISFAGVTHYGQADTVWWRALNVMGRTGGLHTYSEAPTKAYQPWAYFQATANLTDGSGDHDFWGKFDARGGLGFQHELAMIAQVLGLKMQAGGPGSPYSLMSTPYIPANSYNSGSYGFMETPGAAEIAALQAMYGANTNHKTGNDVYTLATTNVAGGGWTTVWDAGGTDTFDASMATTPVSINLNQATLIPGHEGAYGYKSHVINTYSGFMVAKGVAIEIAKGGSSNDLIVADDGLVAQTLYGGAGDDTYYIDEKDTVIDLQGNNKIYLKGVLIGGVGPGGTDAKGRTIWSGTNKAEKLVGGSGSDWLKGGKGKDFYTGGKGEDFFVFESISSKDFKKVTDFNVREDSIVLKYSKFKKLSKPKKEESTIKSHEYWKSSNGKAHDLNDRVLYNSSNGDVLYDADGSGRGAAVKIGNIGSKKAATYKDFLIDL
jgi:serralysin